MNIFRWTVMALQGNEVRKNTAGNNFTVTLSNIGMQLNIWHRVQLDPFMVCAAAEVMSYCCGTKGRKTCHHRRAGSSV